MSLSKPFKIRSSLHRALVDFKPRTPGVIYWYNCGPTVYADSHLGHARNYVTIDIIRRILLDYMHYDVYFVQNVTDVDDKIINKAQRLDVETKQIAFYYETAFFEDMAALNVLPPSAILRATDVIKDSQKFISKLIDGGFAYESHGSVYFDTEKYRSVFPYPELSLRIPETPAGEPKPEGEAAPAAPVDGEDPPELASEKHHPRDFALWKFKEGEKIWWESPWAVGRPGWHAECSAISLRLLGEQFDLHSGGEDLQFPHHANEIAQSQAYHLICENERRHQAPDTKPDDLEAFRWVGYWVHCGHLEIQGQKMSKSKKNFTTIREGLKTYSARQMRLLFCYHQFDDTFEFSSNTFDNPLTFERKVVEFLRKSQAFLRTNDKEPEKPQPTAAAKPVPTSSTEAPLPITPEASAADEKASILSFWAARERGEVVPPSTAAERPIPQMPNLYALSEAIRASPAGAKLFDVAAKVDAALCNSFNVPDALKQLEELITATNKVLNPDPAAASSGASSSSALSLADSCGLVKAAVGYLLYILGVFGVDFSDITAGSEDKTKQHDAVLDQVFAYRDQMRILAQKGLEAKKDPSFDAAAAFAELCKDILRTSDVFRNDTLPNLGIRLEDKGPGQPAVWSYVSPEELRKEKEEKEKREAAKREAKLKLEQAKLEKERKARMDPRQMFREMTEEVKNEAGEKITRQKYSEFDEDGIPTKDADGKPISDSQIKKLKKQWEKQKAAFEKATKDQKN